MIKKIIKVVSLIALMLSHVNINVHDIKKDYDKLIKVEKKLISVFVTVYKYSTGRCITADGSVIRPGVMWCAVSPDMLKKHGLKFGDTIVYKDTKYAIHDLTHRRLKNTVDILVHDDSYFSESSTIYIN